jgi:hypothetical protein
MTQIPHKGNSQKRYTWVFDDSYNITRRTDYRQLTKNEYIQTHLTQSRAPSSGGDYDKYKQLLSDIYDKFKPSERKTTRAIIQKIE